MKKISIVIFITSVVFTCSCSKLVDVEKPKNTLFPEAVFRDSTQISAAVGGMYAGFAFSNTYQQNFTTLISLYSDETSNINYSQYQNNAIPLADFDLENMWSESYATIYRCNAILEGINASPLPKTGITKRAIGEALFFRALSHFNLANLFSRVPLILSTDVTQNIRMPQATATAIYGQSITDLKQAISYLPSDYVASGNERTRVNKFAAIALLAKVYLYNQEWSNAEDQASLVIADSQFELPNDLSKIFSNVSTEAILQFDSSPSEYTQIGIAFIPLSGTPEYIINNVLLDSFEPGDQRKLNWIAYSNGFAYPSKYKRTRGSTGAIENNTVLRLAEQYLIRAEAKAQQNKISQAQADLNMIRSRAGLANTTALDQVSLLLAIEQERKVELFCEWGNRFFDLKRTGRANEVLGTTKPGWKTTKVNLPIPGIELSKNPSLSQNDGY